MGGGIKMAKFDKYRHILYFIGRDVYLDNFKLKSHILNLEFDESKNQYQANIKIPLLDIAGFSEEEFENLLKSFANKKTEIPYIYFIENDIEKHELNINFSKYVKEIKIKEDETFDIINTLIHQIQEW